jgi:hypothetical protein
MSKRIFISYSHEDAAVADRIVTLLDTAGMAPWIDRREIRPGESIPERMSEGLTAASYVVLLHSQASAQSRWVTREWMSTLAAADTVIVPIVLDDTEVPRLLQDILYIDCRSGLERGLEQLIAFFRNERQSPIRTRGASGAPLAGLTRRQLRLVAVRCMNESALRNFCFDADILSTELTGSSVQERLVSLLHNAATQGLLSKFSEWLHAEHGPCVQTQINVLKEQSAWDWKV